MAIEFSGFLYDDAGDAVNGATVNLYDRNTTTGVRATTTTNSSGFFTISHGTQGRFDIEVVNGSSKRRLKYDNEWQMETLETKNFRMRNPGNTYEYDIVPQAITAARQLNLPLIGGTATLIATGTPLLDDETLVLGTGSDVKILWSDADADNHSLVIGVGDSNQSLHITDLNAIGTDWDISSTTHPNVYIHSNTNPATEYLRLGSHDATSAEIDVVGGTTLKLMIDGTSELSLTATALAPTTSDGSALGTASLMWGDLFLASASVINWNNGDITLTHGAGTLTFGGDGTVGIDFNNHEMTNVDIDSGAIDGATIGAASTASIAGTTIDASTDFTIGDTVITDGVITDSTGLQIAAAVDLNNNALSNVGAAGNDWTQNKLSIAGGTADQNLEVTTTGSDNWVTATLAHPASGTGGVIVLFKQGDGSGSANNMSYYVGYDGSGGYLKCRSRDTDGSSTDADIWRIPDGQLSVDANTTWDANVFDTYDDVSLIRSAISPTAEAYDFGQGALLRGRDVLIEIGVLRKYEDGFVGYNDQRMAALLAGGIYQNRSMMEDLDKRLQALGG